MVEYTLGVLIAICLVTAAITLTLYLQWDAPFFTDRRVFAMEKIAVPWSPQETPQCYHGRLVERSDGEIVTVGDHHHYDLIGHKAWSSIHPDICLSGHLLARVALGDLKLYRWSSNNHWVPYQSIKVSRSAQRACFCLDGQQLIVADSQELHWWGRRTAGDRFYSLRRVQLEGFILHQVGHRDGVYILTTRYLYHIRDWNITQWDLHGQDSSYMCCNSEWCAVGDPMAEGGRGQILLYHHQQKRVRQKWTGQPDDRMGPVALSEAGDILVVSCLGQCRVNIYRYSSRTQSFQLFQVLEAPKESHPHFGLHIRMAEDRLWVTSDGDQLISYTLYQ